jgi:type IV secretory pathway component VirB8
MILHFLTKGVCQSWSTTRQPAIASCRGAACCAQAPRSIALKRTLYTANFVFVFKTNVPNELIPINPLGLAITYVLEDEAFK